ncbi:MAG: endonuclease Q family protein [archaeon]
MFPSDSLFADLHIHSNKNGNLARPGDVGKLVSVSEQKGLGLVGTGDLTNRRWREIVYSETSEADGLQWSAERSEGPQRRKEFPLLLSVEVCCSDKAHHLLLLPDRESARALFSEFAKVGKIEKMGRPFLHIDSRALAETCFGIDKRIELIPAHVWTPHFGMFGEEAHYNSLSEAFGEFEPSINAIETGLSSNPEMNRRMPWLDKKAILSFSDCHAHTLLRIGREATIFSRAESYSEIISQIRKNSHFGTIEVFPEFGKYHWSGHRNCGISLSPEAAEKAGNKCPRCGKPLTRGVESRVFELQKRARGSSEKPTLHTLPIPEIASAVYSVGANSAKVRKIQENFIGRFGSELSALVSAPEAELVAVDENVGKAILSCRKCAVKLTPGYDGIYGKALFA